MTNTVIYTDEEIETQVMKCVDTWTHAELLQFAYDEMYHYYTNKVCNEELTQFMEEIKYD